MNFNLKQQEAYDKLSNGENIFITGPAGTGKCLGINTPIIMYNCDVKYVQDIKKNDYIMGDDSKPRKILSINSGIDDLYLIKCNNDSYVVNSAHILTLKSIKKIYYYNNEYNLFYGSSFGSVNFRVFNSKIELDVFLNTLPDLVDLPLKICYNKFSDKNWSSYFKGVYAVLQFEDQHHKYEFYKWGIFVGKNIKIIDFIGEYYKIAPIKQRLEFLAGIVDVCGIMNKKSYIIECNYKLIDDIIFIIKSCGLEYKCKRKICSNMYIINIFDNLPVKIVNYKYFKNEKKYYSINIQYIGKGRYYGFEIDCNKRFVLGNFIITHNTTLIKSFVEQNKKNKSIAITSTTGTSALLLNGSTLHSYLGIGLGNGSVENLVFKITKSKWYNNRWLNLKCLLIDEVSMLSPDLFDKLENIARIIRGVKKPFGGIQIVLSGDLCQLPCVGTDKFCFQAKTWNQCITNTIYLTEIIRQKDIFFQNVLNNVRIGNITKEVKDILNSRLNLKIKNYIKPTKLFSKNVNVDEINNQELDLLAKDGRQFYEYEMKIKVNPKIYDKQLAIQKFIKKSTVPQFLQICVGAQVMLLKNIDLELGLANGTRGVVIDFIDDIPIVRFINGEQIPIEYVTWTVEENEQHILDACQIPLKIAYAVSIHTSQGSTLDYVEVDLSDVFEYSQAYVALSRVKNLNGLFIKNINYDTIQAHPDAINYYKNLL